MQIDGYRIRAQEFLNKLSEIEAVLDIPDKENQLHEIAQKEQEPSVWQNSEALKKLSQKKRQLEKLINNNNSAKKRVDDFIAILDLFEECGGVEESEIQTALQDAQNSVEALWLDTLLSGKYDNLSCVLTLHSGAGGEEAQDWTEMLSRMYLRYCEKEGFSTTILDVMPGDGAGLKSQAIQIDGDNAYGYLKCEKGVHRLVRLSPFDAAKRRHTSFASVEVSPLIEDDNEIIINPDDIRVDTYRSGGAGGQHINKTDSAVRITHIPTGIVVQCQNERSQIQNKEQAMHMLKGKLAQKMEEERLARMQEILGESKKIEWGSQIRSYILHPYNLVKDHRTGFETSNTLAVLDGDIKQFIIAELKRK